MSAQCGKCNLNGDPVSPEELERVRPLLLAYGPDDEGSICRGNFAALYRAFHTTKESRRERQPFTLASGAVLIWDGRLDNREELVAALGSGVSVDCTDLELVGTTYERWNTRTFPKLIGDWALSIWDPKISSLILAKDFVGTRHLYYSCAKHQVTWCSLLDPLVLYSGHSFQLNEEYIAGWLGLFPAASLTPYIGIDSVPPSCFVELKLGEKRVTRYWDFDPAHQVRYRTDCEYEEHFRVLFAQSVNRRLRSDAPLAAELSGGMDSSSIVCMADHLVESSHSRRDKIETISYYDDSDPNWNERPYLESVERKRGLAGLHINIGSQDSVKFKIENSEFIATPACALARDEAAVQTTQFLRDRGIRVLLSGIGGDEVTGGVPTPAPELADLLVTMKFRRLGRQLKTWALWQRRPWHFLLWEAIREFLPVGKYLTSVRPAPWISSEFAKQHRRALSGYPQRLRFLGRSLPSLQENLHALDALRRQVSIGAQSPLAVCETRYPYLDRNLLEFLYSVPRDQLVRPGQRRSLMRRALQGIVPDEVLTRRRKAYVSRQPANVLRERSSELLAIVKSSASSQIEWIDPDALVSCMKAVEAGDFQTYLPLVRTVLFELWFEVATTHSWTHINPGFDARPKQKRFSSKELEIQKKGVSAHAVQQAGNR